MIHVKYDSIISLENLLEAWKEFVIGKRKRKDVQVFELHLMEHIFDLHNDLKNKIYKHGLYEAFNISDPKPRHIHKASVRDRLLHHAIHRKLYPEFDRRFIADSFSCRVGKGTHKALNRFRTFGSRVSKNNTRTCWVLKCDIKKFFASIDHEVLLSVLKKNLSDTDVLWLLDRVITSFHTQQGKGLPLGNLTSQLLVNIYMNEFDQFVKHALKQKYYIRYADDFVFLSENRKQHTETLRHIEEFLGKCLKLTLHPNKVFIKTLASGVDFLGWVHFPDHRVLRTVTRRGVMKGLQSENESVQNSYLGLLKHGNAYKIQHATLALLSTKHKKLTYD